MTIDTTTLLIAFLLGLVGVGLLALLLQTGLMLHALVKHREWAPAGLLAAVLLVIAGLVVGPPPPATAPVGANVCDLPGVYTDHYRPETKASLCAQLDERTPTTVVVHTTTSEGGR